jgi:uncharacterized Zn finger protein (UPF0148 family)
MQPVALSCPNCGAGLGASDGGQYLCAYCGHRSIVPAVDQANRIATLEAVLARFEARRTRARDAMEERDERRRAAASATRQTNGYVLFGIGGMFLAFAIVCFVISVSLAVAPTSTSTQTGGSKHHPHPSKADSATSESAFIGPLVFGVFWVGLGGGMIYGGVRYSRANRRDRRLRERGLRGRATITSYKQGHVVLDGNPRFELVLEVELPGRSPYVVKLSDWVARPSAVTTGAEVPVFVDPANATDVMVDWFTAGRSD